MLASRHTRHKLRLSVSIPGQGGTAKLGGAPAAGATGQSGRDGAAVPLAHSETWRERKVRRNKAGDEGTLMTKARN